MEIINLNLIPGKAWPVCHASQFDTGREIRVNLFEGAAVYVLSGDEVVDVIIKKPDGNQVTETLTNTADSYVVIVTTEQMTACEGANLGEVRITKGAQVIGSLNFILECEKSPDTGIESHSEINNLESQVAAIVADQYAAEDVVFDNTPTAGHGVGFAVTSEGVLNAIPDELNDLDDVNISGAAQGEALVWNGAEWVNMANPASTANFADAYDPTATYNTGDVCIYNNVLYICTDDNITGTFDPSKWTATTIDNVIGSLSTLTTTDKSSLVGAVNEVNLGKVNVSDLTPKTFSTTTPISIQANETVTQQFTVNNAKYGIITGFAITSNLNVVALQFYFYDATTVQVRVKNVSNVNDVFHISFFYI